MPKTSKAWNGGSPEAAKEASDKVLAGVRGRLAALHRTALPKLPPALVVAPFRDPSEPGWVYLPVEDVVILEETARHIIADASRAGGGRSASS